MKDNGIAIAGIGANGAAIAAGLTEAGLDVTCIEQWPAPIFGAQRTLGAVIEIASLAAKA
jgi:2-dehydropantoate 2-reductase